MLVSRLSGLSSPPLLKLPLHEVFACFDFFLLLSWGSGAKTCLGTDFASDLARARSCFVSIDDTYPVSLRPLPLDSPEGPQAPQHTECE
jgi:hypothetical protein